jgi:hypothetical protein
MPYISHFIKGNAFAEWLATGRHDAHKGANLAPADIAKLGLELGQYGYYDGSVYRAVRARGALTGEGYILKTYANAAGRVGTADAASTKAIVQTADTLVKGDLKGGKITIDGGTGLGQMRNIIDNNDTAGASLVTVAKRVASLNRAAITGAQAFDTALDGTSTYNLHCDWEVVETSGVGDTVVGAALGAVTDGNLTIILVESPYAWIRCVGSTDALTALGTLVPSATAGIAKGFTTAGETAAEARLSFGSPYAAYTGASAIRMCRLFGKFAIGGQRNVYPN